MLRKTFRYTKIYGLRRTIIKGLGRLGGDVRLFYYIRKQKRDIALIGCGQFGFSTISYFLASNIGNRFALCFDILKDNAERTKKVFGYHKTASTVEEIYADQKISTIYIATNHASHTPYAIEAMRAHKDVYIEKPIAVSHQQLSTLLQTQKETGRTLFAGYNRPFSKAIRTLAPKITDSLGPLTLTCVVVGHVLEENHWYRNEGEGTRICGNVGHWLDLAIHLLMQRGLCDKWTIHLAPSNETEPDENVNITLLSEEHDLITITLTARAEPFEGIHESILFQQGPTLARIDDFRKMTLWENDKVRKYNFWPKDVGHKKAILQPFAKDQEFKRNFDEVVVSSIWMLEITSMVRNGVKKKKISLSQLRDALTI